MTTGYVVTVITKSDPWLPVGVRAHRVAVVSREDRTVRWEGGTVTQVGSMGDIYETEAEALMAGARKMQAEADTLAAAAEEARERAAKLAAAGRVTVCST